MNKPYLKVFDRQRAAVMVALLLSAIFGPTWAKAKSSVAQDTFRVHFTDSPAPVFDSCQMLYGSANSLSDNFLWQKAFDTARRYIESCPSYYQSWRGFYVASNAVQGLAPKNVGVFKVYHDWLESVLYLNKTDPEYFCVCVEALAQTFYSPDTTEQLVWQATNRQLAVMQWLIQHTDCDTAYLRRLYTDSRKSQYQDWLNDTTIHLDTTLPSMKDLGLDSLLNLHLGVNLTHSPYSAMLSGFSVSTNPFTSSTALLFDLDKMAYVRFEVYDELGRMLIGDGSGHSYEAGKHQIPIEMKSFATGAYYLRVSLGDGEVRTIKLVKKK